MKPPVAEEDLPTPAETVAVVKRRGAVANDGPNWKALTAGFVCPGGGQWVVGKRLAGGIVFGIFAIACAVGLVPLAATLWSSTAVALGNAAEARPIPWRLLGGGLGVAILTWVMGMLHAALLEESPPTS